MSPVDSPEPASAPSPGSPRYGDPSRGLLVTFLATALIASLVLVAALRLRPQWFGVVATESGGRGALPAASGPAASGPAASEPAASEPAASSATHPDRAGSADGGSNIFGSGVDVFASVERSVVHITARGTAVSRTGVFQFDAPKGSGSGLVWDKAGHIVTCCHLFDQDVRRAIVTLWDGTQRDALLVNLSDEEDLAVLRIIAGDVELHPARLREPGSRVRVGDRAYSVACPYGMLPSLSSGIISAVGRRIETPLGFELGGMLQTDAALHPGTSGGALVDVEGRVIGMNAAIQEDARSLLGIGFAQPIDRIAALVPELVESGFAWVPELGFVCAKQKDSNDLLARLRRDAPPSVKIPDAGLLVWDVDPEGAAARAGLRPTRFVRNNVRVERVDVTDVLVAVGSTRVSDRSSLMAALDAQPPGEPVTLVVARSGGEVELVLEPGRGGASRSGR